ncbi:MAG TPA: bifunctional phosphoserine phosphatase/homoserine phosphotransferase ThrH [Alphaproteobacteria bacterium]|nr:bifunctional phosphoserine phosphatase/homoserine phosphotransferase ThrH [Alphaproteobacteria bacterium]
MFVACLDMEGVLTPEIWVGLAKRTGIEALCRTTRDEPDYDVLMQYRFSVLRENGLGFEDLRSVAASLDPLAGACEFVDWLHGRCQVTVLSDTFYELAQPLVAKLGHPLLICHHLTFDSVGALDGYRLRQADPKRQAVQAFQALNFRTVAVGDSYNDTAMLRQAETGILFRAPEAVRSKFPHFPAHDDYDGLKAEIEKALRDDEAAASLARTGTE